MTVRQHKKGGGVYVWRTRKPHAVIGLPIIGRHTGYVGETNSFRRRGGEHIEGTSRYRELVRAKDWADLSPKVYEISLPDSRRLRLLVEWLLIKILLPVYNDRHNRSNPRRISLKRARAQRFARDQFGSTAMIIQAAIRWGVIFAVAWGTWLIWGWTQ